MHSSSLAQLVNPLHLVSGDSAAGCMRAACASWGMPGDVIGFSDDLAQGPLSDGEPRVAYMRGLLEACGEGGIDGYVPFGEWSQVARRLERDPHDAVIVWTGENAADATFITMACARLAACPVPLWRVRVPGVEQRPYVTMHSPQQLAQLYSTREQLSDATRQQFAQDFVRIRDTCGLVRRLEGGGVVGAPLEHCDPWLLAACGPDWRPAAQVVGTAMGSCDAPNLIGDAFFTARLGFLIDAGRIEASGPQSGLRGRSVRLKGR